MNTNTVERQSRIGSECKQAKPWTDAATLQRLYHDEGLSQHQVADRLGCTRSAIRYWMEKHGIGSRDRIEVLSSDRAHYYTDGAGYEQWVASNGRSNSKNVAVHRLLAVSEWGVDAVAGKDIHHKNGLTWDNRIENLEILGRDEHLRLHGEDESRNEAYRDREKLRAAHEELPVTEIAQEWGVDHTTIRRWMDHHGLHTKKNGTIEWWLSFRSDRYDAVSRPLDGLTDTQRSIAEAAAEDPTRTTREVADIADCHKQSVLHFLQNYYPTLSNFGGFENDE